MLMNKKKTLTQILGDDPREAKESPEQSGLNLCVEELIQAVSNGDVESATQALRSCFQELKSEGG